MIRPGYIVCLGMLLVGAVVHGATTQRWKLFVSASHMMDALHSQKVQLSDYQAEEIPSEMPLKEKSQATCNRYVSMSQNQTVMVSIITGPPGSVSTHTPDVCYPSSGYTMLRPPVRETVDLPGGGQASYYVSEFEKKTATQVVRQRVRWSWSADGLWNAPDRPRFAYLKEPELAKVYIVTPFPEMETNFSSDDSPVIRQFVAATFAQMSGAFGTP
jgi:hypothetical protein